MKVTLIKYTPDALETLLFTKSTRLKMSPTGLEDIKAWTEEKKLEEWRYMQSTIKSSWEFVDYIFLIQGVTRAFTQQLERHRIGTSFAEQALRVVDMSAGFEYLNSCKTEEGQELNRLTMSCVQRGYQDMINSGEVPQDARGVLPLNIQVAICFKANLRTLNTMSAERLCVKAQGEFQDVMRAIRAAVVEVHPWAEPALRVHCAQYGVCAFPSYSGCPFKGGVFNPETGRRWDDAEDEDQICYFHPQLPLTKDEIQAAWEVNRAEAQPTGEAK